MKVPEILVDAESCTLCGSCEAVCVRQVFELGTEAARATGPARCILCGHCEAVCPEDAIRLPDLNTDEFSPAPGPSEIPAPNGLMALFRARRSTRMYRAAPVGKETIERILEAGRFAPTGGNLQPLRHVVVHTPEAMAKVRDLTIRALALESDKMELELNRGSAAGPLSGRAEIQKNYVEILRQMAESHGNGVDRLFWNAPALVVTHAHSTLSGSAQVDAGLGAMQMVLMAEALGLATCFIGFLVIAAAGSQELRRMLQIPPDHTALVSFVTGYPDIRYERLVSRRPARARWL